MVVIGDSLFLSNQMIDKEGNRELAWHTVNWLLDRSHLLQTIGPQPIQTYRFEFKANEFRNLAVILVGLMPLSTLTLGIWFGSGDALKMIRKDTAWLMAIAVFAVGYLLLFEREHTEEATDRTHAGNGV